MYAGMRQQELRLKRQGFAIELFIEDFNEKNLNMILYYASVHNEIFADLVYT